MTSVDRKVFREHFAELRKHPEVVDRAPLLMEINKIFEALRSYKKENPRSITIEGRLMPINVLKQKDIAIFSAFAKKFLSGGVPEEQADQMLKNLALAEQNRGLTSYSVNRDLKEAEKQIHLHAQAEALGLEGGDNVSQAKKTILEDLQLKQREALDLEKKMKQKEKKEQAITIGLAVAGGALGALTIGLAFASLWVILPGLLAAAVLLGVAWGRVKSLQDLGQSTLGRKFDTAMQQLPKWEGYKRSVSEPGFGAFVDELGDQYDRIKADPQAFYQLLDLYSLQKGYLAELEKAKETLQPKDPAKPLAAVMGLTPEERQKVEDLKAQWEHVNALRQELALEPLPLPNF